MRDHIKVWKNDKREIQPKNFSRSVKTFWYNLKILKEYKNRHKKATHFSDWLLEQSEFVFLH